MRLEFEDLYRVAEGLLCARKYREALAIYIILLRVRPESASLWHGIANCLERLNYPGTSQAYEMALKYHLMENEKRSLLWAGWAAMKLGNVEMAYSLFRKSVEEDPNYAYTWISLAAAASRMGFSGEAEEARKMYRNMVTAKPYKKRDCEGKEMLRDVASRSDGVLRDFLENVINDIGCDEQ